MRWNREDRRTKYDQVECWWLHFVSFSHLFVFFAARSTIFLNFFKIWKARLQVDSNAIIRTLSANSVQSLWLNVIVFKLRVMAELLFHFFFKYEFLFESNWREIQIHCVIPFFKNSNISRWIRREIQIRWLALPWLGYLIRISGGSRSPRNDVTDEIIINFRVVSSKVFPTCCCRYLLLMMMFFLSFSCQPNWRVVGWGRRCGVLLRCVKAGKWAHLCVCVSDPSVTHLSYFTPALALSFFRTFYIFLGFCVISPSTHTKKKSRATPLLFFRI